MLIVAEAISLVKVAVILLLSSTPVTIGVVARGLVAVTMGASPAMPPPPRIGACPTPHPASITPSRNAINHAGNMEWFSDLLILFICLPVSFDSRKPRRYLRPSKRDLDGGAASGTA